MRLVADRVALKVPSRCPACRREKMVKLEQTIKGDSVLLSWCCRACDHHWPVRLTPPKTA